jgi:hypothetical protein
LLKVVNHQCEILEDDLTFSHFLQQGTGLYLLQALNILAEQVCYICIGHHRHDYMYVVWNGMVQCGVDCDMILCGGMV